MQRLDNPDVILTDVMASHAKWRAEKTALVCGDRRLTWPVQPADQPGCQWAHTPGPEQG